jgi:hypothetical protein
MGAGRAAGVPADMTLPPRVIGVAPGQGMWMFVFTSVPYDVVALVVTAGLAAVFITDVERRRDLYRRLRWLGLGGWWGASVAIIACAAGWPIFLLMGLVIYCVRSSLR